MICSIIKWMISQSLDSESPLPAIIKRHIERCESCREFLSDVKLLGVCLERDALRLEQKPSFTEENNDVVMPAVYSLRLAVVTVCVLVVSGFLVVHSVKTTMENGAALSHMAPHEGITALLSMSGISPETLAVGPESGLSIEINYLAQDVKSAAKHLAGSIGMDLVQFN
ncbi:MAG: hypothetical protein PHR77_08030 [Kiritimatiellae bacterium]|nr:hypothetical protein [Kiritimatiellia bacterium]MDD5521564.1 hypothetical protein [Kiritimatiellia bacterium]